MKKKVQYIGAVIIGLIVINIVATKLFTRVDLTSDKRYTLSDVALNEVSKINNLLFVEVYLEGDLPSEFHRLQTETRQFLEELEASNSKVRFSFVNPDDKRKELVQQGMYPNTIVDEQDGKLTKSLVFPYAKIRYGTKSKIIQLIPNTMFRSKEEQLSNAIANLEFSFIEAINYVTQNKTKKIAIVVGNGELEDKHLGSLLLEVRNKYKIGKFSLDSVANNPISTLETFKEFDLAIIAKPTERFSTDEKLVLDQFINNGGRSIWMIDNNISETDSLARKEDPQTLIYPRDLNLTDLLFAYGVRINNKIIQDVNAAKLRLAMPGPGGQARYEDFSWLYHPLAMTNPVHSITKNVMPVRLRFATQIDTLSNNLKKTPLLVSSRFTRKIGTPNIVKLSSITKEPKQEDFNEGNQLFGVLIEGHFNSAYKDRTLPFDMSNFRSGVDNKMLVISDGDICKNQILKGRPLDLGVDKWTRQRFGNKDFLLNSIDYLLDDSGLIQLRNKTVQLHNLDKQKVKEQKGFWKFLNIILPLFLLAVFGLIFNYFRKKKYC